MNNQTPASGNNFNVEKKAEAKNAAPQNIDKQNEDDMDANRAQKVKSNAGKKSGAASMTDEQWKAKIATAKQQWSKLQQEELIGTHGDSEQLSTLVQKRYSMNKSDADKQVKEFFKGH